MSIFRVNMLSTIQKELNGLENKEKSKTLSKFFKTGKGEYGEGDIFLGINVPLQRKLAKKYNQLPLSEIKVLLSSPVHEHRLTSLLILIEQYNKASLLKKDEIVKFYLENLKYINNWDLVDLSAPLILGSYLLNKEKARLYQLVKSSNLWERRIAIISTYTFIKNRQFEDTLNLANLLLEDKEDLIHKAVGWMLREVGKRDQQVEEKFLKENYKKMPRTMLRYAIEKFKEEKRKVYLKK